MLAVLSGRLTWFYFIYRANALTRLPRRLRKWWFHSSATISRDFILCFTARWQSQAAKLARNSLCGLSINRWRQKPVLSTVSRGLLAKYIGYLKIVYFAVCTRNKAVVAWMYIRMHTCI